jgi:hypothetical protein
MQAQQRGAVVQCRIIRAWATEYYLFSTQKGAKFSFRAFSCFSFVVFLEIADHVLSILWGMSRTLDCKPFNANIM